LTQFSYFGQLDEHFKIIFNRSQISKEILRFGMEEDEISSKKDDKKKHESIFLNQSDPLLEEISDLMLDDCQEFLVNKIKSFQDLTKRLKDEKNQGLLKEAVYEKKNIRKYKLHLCVALHIIGKLKKPTNLDLFEYEQVVFIDNIRTA